MTMEVQLPAQLINSPDFGRYEIQIGSGEVHNVTGTKLEIPYSVNSISDVTVSMVNRCNQHSPPTIVTVDPSGSNCSQCTTTLKPESGK